MYNSSMNNLIDYLRLCNEKYLVYVFVFLSIIALMHVFSACWVITRMTKSARKTCQFANVNLQQLQDYRQLVQEDIQKKKQLFYTGLRFLSIYLLFSSLFKKEKTLSRHEKTQNFARSMQRAVHLEKTLRK